MASLIPCPHCGQRPKEEFTIRGDASVVRPSPEAGEPAWFAYVYQRENPRGAHKEHWFHSGGCRRWLIVERDTATHHIYAVDDAATVSRKGGEA
ncbi:sarcosine oxidase subunit delta [Sinorhizobium sp. BG8]|uniref:sarcosine oxidase subunit delta n=1 Tax=Sinorhizobium sp. BG8 TaxID=2613773 RepID=UPI00193E7D90|nr:sarcosine oxidase subunit delta [Sinorhizobium sp. BG8]QRM53930.1 sarcosine oxidase subunit delta [Sinorhizobium sp. BG8]